LKADRSLFAEVSAARDAVDVYFYFCGGAVGFRGERDEDIERSAVNVYVFICEYIEILVRERENWFAECKSVCFGGDLQGIFAVGVKMPIVSHIECYFNMTVCALRNSRVLKGKFYYRKTIACLFDRRAERRPNRCKLKKTIMGNHFFFIIINWF
jgi:hypothetical protein